MICKCGSDVIVHFSARCSDLCFVDYDGLEHDGYAPDFGFCGGDYLDFHVCMNCGTIQNFKPMTADEVITAIEEA